MAQSRNTKLQKLFEKRTAQYEKSTDAILETMDGVVEGIKLYARSEGLLTDDNTLEIMAASLDSETGFVFLAGYFKARIGTSVVLETGESIDIETEEERSMYGKMLRINISPELIEENDAEYTCKYVIESMNSMSALMDTLKAAMQDEDDDEVETFAVLTEDDKQDEERLRKILEGATNPKGMFN